MTSSMEMTIINSLTEHWNQHINKFGEHGQDQLINCEDPDNSNP